MAFCPIGRSSESDSTGWTGFFLFLLFQVFLRFVLGQTRNGASRADIIGRPQPLLSQRAARRLGPMLPPLTQQTFCVVLTLVVVTFSLQVIIIQTLSFVKSSPFALMFDQPKLETQTRGPAVYD